MRSTELATSIAISHVTGATRARAIFLRSQLVALVALTVSGSAFAGMMINPTYDTFTMMNNGLSPSQITSVETAFAAAAAQFTNNFNDPININIAVTAAAGTGIFGQSNWGIVNSSYTTIYTALNNDAKTADDNTSLGSGGSVPTSDPVTGRHSWWTTTAEAKALGLIPDNATTIDGTFIFGAGWNYSFDPNNVGPAQFDFEGVATHEISEIMGRIPGLGSFAFNGIPAYVPYDLYRYTGEGAANRGLTNGSGIYFSIDNGTTNLMNYNFPNGNGTDPQDWASGTNDSFNASSSPGVRNALTPVDLRVMDVIGYDRTNATPEPSTGMLLIAAFLAGCFIQRRARS
jgi:hypothetical protein